ncbi:hypothetical protein [Rhodopirellula islandica]|uniref:hypothetical protein n=1 Tax=Rhodopirellula islandica TaxID=595434 RepID=UPI00064A6FA9|nr:hypothetical protein [Rhodopirellula islandica]
MVDQSAQPKAFLFRLLSVVVLVLSEAVLVLSEAVLVISLDLSMVLRCGLRDTIGIYREIIANR